MSAFCIGAAMLGLGADRSAVAAESKWIASSHLSTAEIRALCGQVSNVRLLARMQMISTGDARWRRLSRQELVFETAIMGVPPLDPDRCHVLMRAGPEDEGECRAFEVLDFVVNAEQTSAFIIGRGHDSPLKPGHLGRCASLLRIE
jgi:hypothetical protein